MKLNPAEQQTKKLLSISHCMSDFRTDRVGFLQDTKDASVYSPDPQLPPPARVGLLSPGGQDAFCVIRVTAILVTTNQPARRFNLEIKS